jgi:hypothetical protein
MHNTMFFFVHFKKKKYFSYFFRSQNYLYQLQTTVVFYQTKERILLTTSFVFRLSIMRHEMLNFLRNLHSYVATQVLEVSWLEFQVL